jgi:hypothetical protein
MFRQLFSINAQTHLAVVQSKSECLQSSFVTAQNRQPAGFAILRWCLTDPVDKD